MSIVEQMKARIAEHGAEALTEQQAALAEHQAEIERDHAQQEKRIVKATAARGLNGHGLDIPPLPERPAELIELTARRAQLSRDRQAIETELQQIEKKRWQEQQGDVDALDEAAERIAAGATELAASDAVPEAIETLRIRLDVARRAERKVALRVAEGQERHNRSIAKALRPLHRNAVRRIHEALLELEAANAEEVAVRTAVPGAPLQSFSFPNLGSRGPNGGGLLQYWINYARRLGMLTDDDDRAVE